MKSTKSKVMGNVLFLLTFLIFVTGFL